ncbi:MAG: winged helix-turn-helix transcriptional regulator [Rubrobacteridae bacterium]|nr:winged helix-turn-helix transcriptional regulator [Rubrobacteridae bacterium]
MYCVMNDELLKTFSNLTRLKILACLGQGAKNETELIGKRGTSQSAVSQHLSLLKELKVIDCRREGREQYYEVIDREASELSMQLLKYLSSNDSDNCLNDLLKKATSNKGESND